MQVRFVLLAIAVLLGLGTALAWNRGWLGQSDLVEAGQAATTPGASERTSGGNSAGVGTSPKASGADERASTNGTVRVSVSPVRKGEVPIYLSGIGTVQAYYTVNVQGQVSGVILQMPFQEGQDVKIGDPIVIIDPEVYQAKLDLARAEKARAEAMLENAKTNLWRDEQLLKHEFSTQKQTDSERMLVGQYTAEIAQYEAEIKYAQAQLNFATIRSPINGRIGIRNVDPGNLIEPTAHTTLVTVVQLKPISVLITVAAKEVEQHGISLGLTDLPVTCYAENGITPLGRGRVQTVNNSVAQTTGTIILKAGFENEQEKLWPGDFVDCRIVVDKQNNGLTVPSAAIRHGSKGDYVWAVTPDNLVRLQPVRVRQSIGGAALVEGRLEEGENVVLDGYQRLQNGARVQIIQDGTTIGSRASHTE